MVRINYWHVAAFKAEEKRRKEEEAKRKAEEEEAQRFTSHLLVLQKRSLAFP